MVEQKTLLPHVFSLEESLSPSKHKSNIVFSVFLSLEQNLMKLEKRSEYLFNKFT